MSRYDEMKRIADAELVRVARSVSRARTALETAERQQAALKKYWKRALEGAKKAEERRTMSENAKHTPGPWNVIDVEHGVVVSMQSKSLTKYGASRYAVVGGFERSDPEQHAEALANARLIAAAPEMFDALCKVMDAFAFSEGPSTHGFATFAEAYRASIAALKKARGEHA